MQAFANDYFMLNRSTTDLEAIVKYLCLVYQDEKVLNALSGAEYDKLVGEALGYVGELKASGNHVDANALELVDCATTIRIARGKVTTTDGPFAETREQLGGYYMIEARDLNDAIRLAAKIPSARLGSIEVRPVKDLLSGQR